MASQATEKKQQIAQMTEEVKEQELSARSWKAYWEKMYYTIECSKIEAEYAEVAAENQRKFKEQQEKMQNLMNTMNTGVETKDGTIKMAEA